MTKIRNGAVWGGILSLVLSTGLSGQALQSEMAADLAAVGEKYVSLAKAVPASAYDWRPGEGVRSIQELYMHVAGAGFGLPTMVGYDAVTGVPSAWTSNPDSVTDKDEIVRALTASFANLQKILAATPDADLDNMVMMFGGERTLRSALSLIQTHAHEHLGQSIAYARTNGVTPPWSM